VFGILYQLPMIDNDDVCGTVDGKKIGKGNRSTRKKTCPYATFFHHTFHMT
jgi:hypothetical protein